MYRAQLALQHAINSRSLEVDHENKALRLQLPKKETQVAMDKLKQAQAEIQLLKNTPLCNGCEELQQIKKRNEQLEKGVAEAEKRAADAEKIIPELKVLQFERSQLLDEKALWGDRLKNIRGLYEERIKAANNPKSGSSGYTIPNGAAGQAVNRYSRKNGDTEPE